MKCSNCGFSDFRPSKIRWSARSHLLRLQFPLRCRICGQRVYANLLVYLAIRAARKLKTSGGRSNPASH